LYYQLVRKNMKYIRLKLQPQSGEVIVSAPHHVAKNEIDRFVLSRTNWILKHQLALRTESPALAIDPEICKPILLEKVPPLIESWSSVLGVQCAGWRMRYMNTRWGSCNVRTHWINLNLALAKLAEPLLEYVVVHELTHLLERGHNKHFYAALRNALPDYREREKELAKIRFYRVNKNS